MRKLTWQDIDRCVRVLASKVKAYRPDVVIGIARGGLIPAVMLSHLLRTEFDFVRILFYTDIEKHLERPLLLKPVTIRLQNKRVLIVDDVVDTGKTMQVAIEHVRHCGAMDVRTAALCCKTRTLRTPDYYVEFVDHWVVFPWER